MNAASSQNEKGHTLRTFFLAVLKVAFISMCYFYISELYGAISTPYIQNGGYRIIFSGSLLLFTFLSVLAGKYLALIAGFLGEFT